MMMPANYSAVAENELTYVVGGASFIEAVGAVTAPIWNTDNVKTFSTNVVTLIGNKFLSATINNTLGVIFSGDAHWSDVKGMAGALVGADSWKKKNYGDGIAQVLGTAAAVYNLGRADVANKASSASIGAAWNESPDYTGKTIYYIKNI